MIKILLAKKANPNVFAGLKIVDKNNDGYNSGYNYGYSSSNSYYNRYETPLDLLLLSDNYKGVELLL